MTRNVHDFPSSPFVFRIAFLRLAGSDASGLDFLAVNERPRVCVREGAARRSRLPAKSSSALASGFPRPREIH